MTDQPTPRCLAWIEGVGRCERPARTDYYPWPYPHCEAHHSECADWGHCYDDDCAVWFVHNSDASQRYCPAHAHHEAPAGLYLGGSHPAAEQGVEAAEALASWLRAAVESRSASTEEAHRAYVARHGCPWPAGSCEVCQVAPPAPARCAVSWYCPEAPEEGSTYCRAHRCGKEGCEGARWRSFGLCAGCLPEEATR